MVPISVAVGSGSVGSGQKLALGIVGVGDDLAVRSGVGGNVAKGIIGIAVAGRAGQAAVADLADLGGGLGVRQILVCIAAGVDTCIHAAQPPQIVVAVGQGLAGGTGHRGQTSVGAIIGIGFRKCRGADLPALSHKLIVVVVGLAGAHDEGVALIEPLAGDQPAQAVVGVDILAQGAVVDAVELPVAGVGIAEGTSAGIGSGLIAAQIVVSEADRGIVAIGLLGQRAVVGTVDVGGQYGRSGLYRRHIAEVVVDEVVDLGQISADIRPGDLREKTTTISIIYLAGICNRNARVSAESIEALGGGVALGIGDGIGNAEHSVGIDAEGIGGGISGAVRGYAVRSDWC